MYPTIGYLMAVLLVIVQVLEVYDYQVLGLLGLVCKEHVDILANLPP